MAFGIPAATWAAYAVIAGAVVGAGTGIYSAVKPTPVPPTPALPQAAPQIKAIEPPKAAPTNELETADAKARQAAVRKQRDLESRRSSASTILTSPLGVSTPPGNVQSTVLGR